MTIIDDTLPDILRHARACSPNETCGLIVTYRRKSYYHPCRNISSDSRNFVLDPRDYADAEDAGTITHIVHSHPTTNPAPSQADLLGIERTGLPWIIVNPITEQYTVTEPSGYKAPLVGRPFVHGVTDCWSLIRDYYAELGIALPDFERDAEWWRKGGNLYEEHIEGLGFVRVEDGLQLHDLVLMQLASPVINHGGVYSADNVILHHVSGKLSSRDVYGGHLRKITRWILRHRQLIK